MHMGCLPVVTRLVALPRYCRDSPRFCPPLLLLFKPVGESPELAWPGHRLLDAGASGVCHAVGLVGTWARRTMADIDRPGSRDRWGRLVWAARMDRAGVQRL